MDAQSIMQGAVGSAFQVKIGLVDVLTDGDSARARLHTWTREGDEFDLTVHEGEEVELFGCGSIRVTKVLPLPPAPNSPSGAIEFTPLEAEASQSVRPAAVR